MTCATPLRRRFWAALNLRPVGGIAGLVAVAVAAAIPQALAADRGPGLVHALAMHDAPKYPRDFSHLDYVDPAAPKGGTLRLARIGSFDSLNPYIVKGTNPPGRRYVFESLLKRTNDEPFTLYGLIAEAMEVAPDRSWIRFHLRPQARFHDDTPITTDDVAFSYETLRSSGRPNHRIYYKQVDRVAIETSRVITFHFNVDADREMPLIIGLLPILSQSYYRRVEFNKTTLVPPLGSGPYRINKVDPGRSIVYRRVVDHWARDLPINRGQYNFDAIRYDFYRDANIRFEAFKAGNFDFHRETSAARWVTGYNFPAVTTGKVIKASIDHQRPAGMHAIVFNTRREVFAQPLVRHALAYAFDFEWLNENLFHGAYSRSGSFYANSDLAAVGLPKGKELALLEQFRGQLPSEVFNRIYRPPASDGSGSIRENLKRATSLMAKAGWTPNDARMRDANGLALSFELLLAHPSNERIALAYARNLRRLGIDMKVRTVDWAQYQFRTQNFDFDAVIKTWHQSLSPGNEQRYYWGSAAADIPGSANLAGVRDPVIDHLTDAVARAIDRPGLVASTRALDRALLWGHYVVPMFHAKRDQIAYWNRLGRPATAPASGYVLDAWWQTSAEPVPSLQTFTKTSPKTSQ